MKIFVKAKPNSKEEKVEKIDDQNFVVSVKEPPEKGKANEKIRELLAQLLKIPKSKISLVSGETYKEKVFEVN